MEQFLAYRSDIWLICPSPSQNSLDNITGNINPVDADEMSSWTGNIYIHFSTIKQYLPIMYFANLLSCNRNISSDVKLQSMEI